jgi:hypothetical protein
VPRWIVNGNYRGAEPALFGMARLRFNEIALNHVPLDWNPIEDMRPPRLTSKMLLPSP